MRLRVVVAIVLSTALRAQAAEPGEVNIPSPLTLAQAQTLFRASSLDLLVADAAVESAAGDRQIAGAVANPSAGAGYFRSFFTKGLYETDQGWSVSIGDSNAIADALSGKRGLRIRVASSALAGEKWRRADTERVLMLAFKQTFLQAALANQALAFAREVAASAAQTLALNDIRYRSGAISEVDLSKTETAKLEADQAVDIAVNAVRQAKVSLSLLLGRRRTFTDFEVSADRLVSPLPDDGATRDPQDLARLAFENRPDLRGQGEQRAQATAALDLAHRQRIPDIGLDLQYQEQGSGQQPANPSTGAAITPPTLLLALTTTLPIFYQQQGELRKAEAGRRTADLGAARLTAQVVSDVDSAHSALVTARGQLERMQQRLLERARRTRDLVEIQYRKGAASLLDYLDAQRTYIGTNLEYFQDLNNYWSAVFQLEAAVGTEILK